MKNKKDIIFTLFDEKMGILRTSIINGQNVEDGNLLKFVFDPIPNSKGSTYFFTITSPSAGPEETIEVFYSQNMPDWIEEYTYDEETHKGGLPIVLYFKPSSKLNVIRSIYTNWIIRFTRTISG